ncbi:MAG: outer membrane beta-barrel protein, partial [Micropepsaceae bacterium]
MKNKILLLGATAMLALTLSLPAQATDGWYISATGGVSQVDDFDFVGTLNPDTGPNAALGGTYSVDPGWVVIASTGYGMGSWRVEVEGGFRHNNFDSTSDIEMDEWSAMMNVLYDIQLSRSFKLSFGAGAGGDFLHLKQNDWGFDDDSWNFAYQGIAGLSVALSKHLDLVIDYHYLRVAGPDLSSSVATPGLADISLDDISKHALTAGIRYTFGAEPPPPP